MRADVIDFKDGSVGVVDVIEPEVGPVLAGCQETRAALELRRPPCHAYFTKISKRNLSR
jgi:hypothetical protein